ncbi:DUF5688 family protein [Hornefia butyriciproducens]|uniref:DUF5688 family protein n=1 Tax=Hornefia butyriciproducens TaxID=2652293 RepID=UPI003F8AB5A4
MREKEFMEMAKQEILRQLPEYVRVGLSLKEVVKINDQKNHGFSFQKDGSKASPTLYLDQAYDLFRHGASLERLMGDVTRAYLESIDRGLDSAEPDLSFDNIRDKLSLRLVETKRNREYLMDNSSRISDGTVFHFVKKKLMRWVSLRNQLFRECGQGL